MEIIERQYALTKIQPGDYLLPSNDAQTIWRIARYTDGPSNGLIEWSRNREVWGIWRWKGTTAIEAFVHAPTWDSWEFVCGPCDTRSRAISEALTSRL
jgi:hypothetical protein